MQLRFVKPENPELLKYHELCTLFPEMDEDTYEDLVKSMQNGGFFSTDPIVVIDVSDGDEPIYHILDGRNRHLAAADARIEPSFVELVDGDPMAFVLSKNLSRRHLTTGQKAAIASRLANIKMGGNQHSEGETAVSQSEAAKLMDTSDRSIRRFNELKQTSPELAAKVESGELSLNAALKKESDDKKPEPEQEPEQDLAERTVESAEDTVAKPAKGEQVCPHCGQPM